eukprot:8118085-Lingulodinium_polyedra.AAC.1
MPSTLGCAAASAPPAAPTAQAGPPRAARLPGTRTQAAESPAARRATRAACQALPSPGPFRPGPAAQPRSTSGATPPGRPGGA